MAVATPPAAPATTPPQPAARPVVQPVVRPAPPRHPTRRPARRPGRREPGRGRQWMARVRRSISDDLAVHGLADLGALLLFAGLVRLRGSPSPSVRSGSAAPRRGVRDSGHPPGHRCVPATAGHPGHRRCPGPPRGGTAARGCHCIVLRRCRGPSRPDRDRLGAHPGGRPHRGERVRGRGRPAGSVHAASLPHRADRVARSGRGRAGPGPDGSRRIGPGHSHRSPVGVAGHRRGGREPPAGGAGAPQAAGRTGPRRVPGPGWPSPTHSPCWPRPGTAGHPSRCSSPASPRSWASRCCSADRRWSPRPRCRPRCWS